MAEAYHELQIAEDLALPLEIVTQAIGILAKRRAGKSYTAAKLVEQLFRAGEQVVVADPKGDWWGLRSSADGTKPGLPILILGGEHGDLPLEAGAGEPVAQLVVEERISALLDLSSFRKHQVATFMTGFLETLYRLKAQERYRTPLMLVIDEADAIAPQRPQRGEERMLGAAEDIVRRGGQRGLGCTMATQRAAVLNKNVLTQIEVLVALRTIAPQDLAALNDWIDVHGTPAQRKTLMESLPALPVGTAWVWSPGWPTDEGIFRRVQVARRETYDSSATPKPGERRVEPRNLADVDLTALQERMAATIERARADDPAALRRRIAELERQLRERPAAPRVERVIERVEVPVLDPAIADRLGLTALSLTDTAQSIGALAEAITRAVGAATGSPLVVSGGGDRSAPAGQLRVVRSAEPDVLPPAPAREPPPRPAPVGRQAPAHIVPHGTLPRAERLILAVLAQYPEGRTKTQVALLAGYAVNGGGFNNAVSAARTKGYLAGGKDLLCITDAGRAALGSWEPLPAGRALLEHWLAHPALGKAERAILRVLYDASPAPLTKEEVAERAGYEVTGGGFNNALSRLRTLELMTRGAELLISDMFFAGALMPPSPRDTILIRLALWCLLRVSPAGRATLAAHLRRVRYFQRLEGR